jgi:hypothetical protein
VVTRTIAIEKSKTLPFMRFVIGIDINRMICPPRPMVKSKSPPFNWQIRLELLKEMAIRSGVDGGKGMARLSFELQVGFSWSLLLPLGLLG